MQSLMGETTPVAHGGNPLWRHWLPKTALHRFIFGLPFELHTETTEFL
ncbi:hypothetical protein [Moorena producens]|nr:hypothetical protein [Moorena producens]